MLGWRSLPSALPSICLTRSRVMPSLISRVNQSYQLRALCLIVLHEIAESGFSAITDGLIQRNAVFGYSQSGDDLLFVEAAGH